MKKSGWYRNLSTTQRRKLLGTVIGSVLLITLGAIGFLTKSSPDSGSSCILCLNSTATPTATATVIPTATPAPLVSRSLDGVLVPQDKASIRPLAVMIENHPDARPQSGLSSANLVYEAIAEGGITRFMAVFADPSVAVRVGPVRSARTYFLDFATELNAYYAHVGGNIDALDQIKQQGGVGNLDQFSVGAPVYGRDSSRKVAIEHTMYSSTDKLWNYAQTKDMTPFTSSYTPWKFIDSALPGAHPATEPVVSINFSTASYKVTWTYDGTHNIYLRNLAGAAHIDANTNTQISASNIVLETVNHTHITTRMGEDGWRFQLTGSGTGVLIQNGSARPISWKKSGTGRTIYSNSDGTEVSFVRGTTWVELVHPETAVSY